MEISLSAVKACLADTKGEWPEVARDSGVDYFTIVRIAGGKSKSPRYETIEKLAEYFGSEKGLRVRARAVERRESAAAA